MDKKVIVARIDELMREKHITGYQLRENAEISTTVYQWRKNAQRDKERVPSLRSKRYAITSAYRLRISFRLNLPNGKTCRTENYTAQSSL